MDRPSSLVRVRFATVANYRKAAVATVKLFVDEVAKTKLDRTHFSIAKLSDSDEKAYWRGKSPGERLEALELMRQMIMATTRLAPDFKEFLQLLRSARIEDPLL